MYPKRSFVFPRLRAELRRDRIMVYCVLEHQIVHKLLTIVEYHSCLMRPGFNFRTKRSDVCATIGRATWNISQESPWTLPCQQHRSTLDHMLLMNLSHHSNGVVVRKECAHGGCTKHRWLCLVLGQRTVPVPDKLLVFLTPLDL